MTANAKRSALFLLIGFITLLPQSVDAAEKRTQSTRAKAAKPEVRLSDIKRPSEQVPVPKSRTVFSRERTTKRPLIVLDPGHGGDDLGAVGIEGDLEKDVVLKIAFHLEKLLEQRLRAQILLTRRTDQAVLLPDRTRIANENNADLFISIHANASEHRNVSGIETYYLDNTNDRSSLKLAERENQSGGGEGVPDDLSFILSDLIQNAKLEDSIALAHHLQKQLVRTLSADYRGVKNLGVKKAPFFVLVGAHMPCALAEVSFIDHPIEGMRLIDPRYQRLIAEAIYRAVRDYFERQAG